jgi:arginyl-tRNA synthetase
MTILESIKAELESIILDKYSIKKEDVKFDVTFIDEINSKFGDVSTNVALILAKQIGKNPIEIAEIIAQDFSSKSYLSNNTNFAAPGFINIFLKKELLISELDRMSKLENVETKFTERKVLIEHSAINLFKPFNIGHLMNNVIGESLVRMMKASGAKLKTMSFPSDISLGIAKAIYILKNKKGWSFEDKDIIKTLGNAYVEGVRAYEDSTDKQEKIKNISKNLFEENHDSEEYKIFEKAKEVNIEYFKNILGKLGTRFDHFIYESEAGQRGEQIVKENINKESKNEVFEMGEGGAIVFDTKKLKNKETNETVKSVFVNSEGHPTYEAKDLGLLELKYAYYPFDYNIFITDNEQIPHFEVVLEVAQKLGEDFRYIAGRSLHVAHGRLNLGEGRISSRLGNALGVEETLVTVNKKAAERLSEKIKDLSASEKEKIINAISLAALRVSILKSKPGLNIDFDMETALNFEGATGPYLLYTYARANSLLEKYEGKEIALCLEDINENHFTLIKKSIQFEALAKKAIEELAPQLVIKYLFELSQAFNTFYAKEKIINEDEKKTNSNIYILKRFMKVFKFTMNMVGIEEVERM